MPTIYKPQKKKKSTAHQDTDMRLLRRKAYNNPAWRKLRNTYLVNHPLCERCLEKGKVEAATDIHHKRTPFKGNEINYALLLDENNLMALCKTCHGEIHGKKAKTDEEIIADLDKLMNL